jgi:hypothetical protein
MYQIISCNSNEYYKVQQSDMIKEIEILLINMNNRFIACKLDEIERVITDISGITGGDLGSMMSDDRKVYKLGDLLRIPGVITYNSLLVLDHGKERKTIIAIPAVMDIMKIKTSRILVVPEYLRRKQNPFVVWGFFIEKNKMIMLITFSYFMEIKGEDGSHEL